MWNVREFLKEWEEMGFVLVGAGWDWAPRALSDSFLSENLHSLWEVCCYFRLSKGSHSSYPEQRHHCRS